MDIGGTRDNVDGVRDDGDGDGDGVRSVANSLLAACTLLAPHLRPCSVFAASLTRKRPHRGVGTTSLVCSSGDTVSLQFCLPHVPPALPCPHPLDPRRATEREREDRRMSRDAAGEQWCYSGVTVVLQWCHKVVAVKGVTVA
jgi:hypothetical protein